LNGRPETTGSACGYVLLDRAWSEGDTVSFALPVALRVERYTGVDQIPNHERYSVSSAQSCWLPSAPPKSACA